MKRKKKTTYQKLSYEQQKRQQSLDLFIPEEVVPWEEKLKERPEPGTPEYKEWWKGLTAEEQLLALEIRQREKDGVNIGTEETHQQSEE